MTKAGTRPLVEGAAAGEFRVTSRSMDGTLTRDSVTTLGDTLADSSALAAFDASSARVTLLRALETAPLVVRRVVSLGVGAEQDAQFSAWRSESGRKASIGSVNAVKDAAEWIGVRWESVQDGLGGGEVH